MLYLIEKGRWNRNDDDDDNVSVTSLGHEPYVYVNKPIRSVTRGQWKVAV